MKALLVAQYWTLQARLEKDEIMPEGLESCNRLYCMHTCMRVCVLRIARNPALTGVTVSDVMMC